jgi:uncharacterized protein (DUF2147 family)
VIKRISLLLAAALLVATMAAAGLAGPAFAQDCVKERGTVTCTTTTSGKNENQPKFQETTTTTTQGNETNFSPAPQGTGTETECGEPCPPGQFK